MVKSEQIAHKELVGGGETSLHTHPTGRRVGYFICPAVTGNYSVTGLGFKPKVVQLWCSKNDGQQTWFHISHGLMDDHGNQNVAFALGNFSNIFRGVTYTDKCIYTTSSAWAPQVVATYVSMDNDGFTLNFINTNSIFIVRWMAF
jgi:hypothetical protein